MFLLLHKIKSYPQLIVSKNVMLQQGREGITRMRHPGAGRGTPPPPRNQCDSIYECLLLFMRKLRESLFFTEVSSQKYEVRNTREVLNYASKYNNKTKVRYKYYDKRIFLFKWEVLGPPRKEMRVTPLMCH